MSATRFVGRLVRGGVLVGDPAPATAGVRHVLLAGFVTSADRAAAERLLADGPRDAAPEGDFCAVVHDPGTGRVTLFGDPLGLRPLFYRATPDAITAATFLEDLAPRCAGAPDDDYLAGFLTFGRPPGRRTPVAGIARLLPGEVVTWCDGRLEQTARAHWARPAGTPERDAARAATRMLDLVAEGIAACVPPGGLVGCELSGGLDSSTVAAVARSRDLCTLEAVSVVHPDTPQDDERAWMRAVLAEHPMRWHQLDGDRHAPSILPAGPPAAEPHVALLADGLTTAYRALATERGFHVLLTGHGGDAVFAGPGSDPAFWADLLLRGRWRSLGTAAGEWQRCAAERRPRTYWLRRHAVMPALAWIREPRGATAAPLVRPGAPPAWLAHGVAARAVAIDAAERGPGPAGLPGRRHTALLVDASVQAARDGLRGAPEPFDHRFPLLHLPLLRFVLDLDPRLMHAPGQTRALQRQAVAGVVPDAVRLRTGKRGATAAYLEGLRYGAEWLTDRPLIVERGLVDRDAWAEAVRRARFGVVTDLRDMLTSVAVEAWLRAGASAAGLMRPEQPAWQRPGRVLEVQDATREG